MTSPPSEPEIWIKHDNNSFPKCHPLDIVRVKFKDESDSYYKERRARLAKDWSWSGGRSNHLAPITEHYISKKYKNDSNI